MNIFRIFFVSTVLIPVLVVVATSDESGIRIRKPRNVVISEDGTRTARRHNPVNISDKNCPSLGCTGNLTTNEYSGKGSLASTLPGTGDGVSSGGKEKRFAPTASSPFYPDHHHPLKLEIKTIKNSTRSDIADYDNYIVANDHDEVGIGRSIISYAIFVSWAFFWTWRVILTVVIFKTLSYFWGHVKKTYGVGDDYIEYYVKLGQDSKHPFHKYGDGWTPTFGVSLKSKVEEVHHGWKGWRSEGQHHGPHQVHYASSYQNPQAHVSPAYYAGAHSHGWPAWPAWPAPKPPKAKDKGGKGYESEFEDVEDNIRHQFDMGKGWKIAKKYAKKYGKKAHKYGLRPSKHSYMFGEYGNIILGGKGEGYAWRR